MNNTVEMMEFIVHAPDRISHNFNNGFRDCAEIVDWLDELEPREDGGVPYSMALAGGYVYFAREEDELAFRLKFGV